MAEAKKKKTTGSNAGSGKSSGNSSSQKKKKEDSSEPKKNDNNATPANKKENKQKSNERNDKNRFWSIVLFALGVLVMLMTLIEGSKGWNAIHNFLLGLFGFSVFFVPVILIYTAVLIGLEKSQKCVSGRAGWGVALTFLISSVIQIIFIGKIPGHGLKSQIAALYRDGKDLDGGGVASLLIAGPLLKIFGKTGTQIIVAVMFFVFLMLLTGKGLMEFLEMISRPFKFIGKCFIGFKNMLTGGDFEDAFDDDEEKKDFLAYISSQDQDRILNKISYSIYLFLLIINLSLYPEALSKKIRQAENLKKMTRFILMRTAIRSLQLQNLMI